MFRAIAAVILIGWVGCAALATPRALVRGQRGHGLSVFAGETPERFEVEILGQLDGAAATGSTYLARLSGASLEQTGVLQGMSGSPVYVDGELIGAVMATWAFAKEALCSIRPIEEMRAVAADLLSGAHPGYRPGATKAMAVATTWPQAESDLASRLVGNAHIAAAWPGELELQTQGFGTEIQADIGARFGARVHAGAALAAAEPAQAGSTLEAGDAMAALLVDGSARLSAVGTVTAREGDAVLAFGHPLLGLGAVSLPMARARIVALMPSEEMSFKIAEPTATVGALLLDRRAGIVGKLGVQADTLPMRVQIREADGSMQNYEFTLARVPQILPDLAAWSARAALLDLGQLGDDAVLRLRTSLLFERGEPWATEATLDAATAGTTVGGEAALGIALALAQREAMPRMQALQMDIERTTTPMRASIGRILVRPERPRPGDELRIQVELREDQGATRWQEMRLRIPAGELAERLELRVSDGESSFRDEIARTPTRWLDPPVATIREALALRTPASALVAVLYAPPRSVLIGGAELRQWPASLRALMGATGGRAAAGPVAATAVARARLETKWRLRGQQVLELQLGEAKPAAGRARP